LSAPGKFEKINTTPEALKTARGGDVPRVKHRGWVIEV
jgi:hypothetical protein